MLRSAIAITVLLIACGVENDPVSTDEVMESVKPPPSPQPPRRCELDATGHETGRCLLDDAAHGTCAYGIRGVVGCQAGRAGTATTSACGRYDQNACSATGWVF